MKNESSIYKEQAKIFQALANPVRLYIINELRDREYCLCDLTKKKELDKSTISRHLKVLKESGITSTRKEGNIVYYSLNLHCILDYIKCVNDLIVHNINEQLKILK